jgi:hypothetical protein
MLRVVAVEEVTEVAVIPRLVMLLVLTDLRVVTESLIVVLLVVNPHLLPLGVLRSLR